MSKSFILIYNIDYKRNISNIADIVYVNDKRRTHEGIPWLLSNDDHSIH